MKLKTFLKQIKQNNLSLDTVQLSLQLNGNVKKLLAALNDEANVGCKDITELDLSGSHLTSNDIEALVKALNKLPNIKTLRLDHCAITDDHTSRHLVELEHVTSLSLKGNLLGKRPAFNKDLKALYLDDNPQLNIKAALLRFSTYAKKLEILSLNKCNVQDEDLIFLMRPGSHLKTLKQLHLHENKLSSIGTHSLKEMSLLEVLDLGQNNQIGDFGVSELQCPALQTLNIEGCNVSPNVFSSLEAMVKLRTLNLSYNPALKLYDLGSDTNPLEQIRKVKLNFCRLTDKNVSSLIALFPNLTHLEIANNQLTQSGVEDFLLVSKHLRVLDVSTNHLYTLLSAKNPKAHKSIAAEKAKIEDFFVSVSQAKGLTHINLSGTGLTDDILPRLIPAEGSARKLRMINGIRCTELKEALEQRREARKNAEAVTLSSPAGDVIEIAAKKPSKNMQIKALKAQVKHLESELAKAKATITQLQGAKISEVPYEKGRVLKQVAQLETKVSAQGIFASTAAKSRKRDAASEAAVITSIASSSTDYRS
ncbi:leucine-rich repeat domain-containing protein [Legionella saoudiensis]|uniref:leucine-rich repeat domain-containing protein n=1 Tax=Legionella saoudiensis TaxID=1750561 RepID=UPI0007307E6E|nr:hypothetical protein [Legionella saoudiensis]